MTATTFDLRRTAPIAALLLVALALRPPGWTALGVTIAVGAAGLLATVERHERASFSIQGAVVIIGCAAFAFVRWRTMLPPPPVAQLAVAGTIAAAVAEEAFFRRFLYARLERYGDAVAIAASAFAFALVHVPAYGPSTFPVNLAAGLLFGWQRSVTKSWAAPAVTHVFANLVQSW